MNNDIRPKYHWGIHLWGFIHTISIIDYENNEPYVIKIIENLKALSGAIPCHKCIALYEEHLKKLDGTDGTDGIAKTESMVLFKWSVDLHNAVNRKHQKPEWTYEQAITEWTTHL